MLYTSDRVTQLRLNHDFNIFYGNAPNYLFEHFDRNEGITRGASNMNYILPKVGSQGTSNFIIMLSFLIGIHYQSQSNKSATKQV